MVARYGGTLGHRVVNLRVVNDATGGNPGFLRALARFVIKTALGILSFTTMALTRRHQAMHDSLTHTTVQVRDLSRARPTDYSVEREAEIEGLPSRGRRLAVIAAYLVALFVVLAAVSGLPPDRVSTAFIVPPRCSRRWRAVLRIPWLALTRV